MCYFCWKIAERGGLRPQTPFSAVAGGIAPKPLASGGWGLRPGPPQYLPPLHDKFLATRLVVTVSITKGEVDIKFINATKKFSI